MRRYKPKNAARKGSKIPKETLRTIIELLLQGAPPSRAADLTELSMPTIRRAYRELRDLFADPTNSLAFLLASELVGAWPIQPPGWLKPGLPAFMIEGWPSEGDALSCLVSCPASLPPLRLRKAIDLMQARSRGEQTSSAVPEFFDRTNCRSCFCPKLPSFIPPRLIDEVVARFSDYRDVSQENVKGLFLTLLLSELLMETRGVFLHYLHDERALHGQPLLEAEKLMAAPLIDRITNLTFEVAMGRKLAWQRRYDESYGLFIELLLFEDGDNVLLPHPQARVVLQDNKYMDEKINQARQADPEIYQLKVSVKKGVPHP